MTKLLSIAAIVTLLIIAIFSYKLIMHNDTELGRTDALMSSIHQSLIQKREKPFSGQELTDLENILENIIKKTERNDIDTQLRAQTYLMDVYSHRAGIAPLVQNKELWSKKSETIFSKTTRARPDYPLPYAIHAASLVVAPDFLGTHSKAQIYFEKALSFVPDTRADRDDDDWDTLAVVVEFYPALLQKLIDQDIDTKANAQRLKEIVLLLEQ